MPTVTDYLLFILVVAIVVFGYAIHHELREIVHELRCLNQNPQTSHRPNLGSSIVWVHQEPQEEDHARVN